jgi:hypothetical protein
MRLKTPLQLVLGTWVALFARVLLANPSGVTRQIVCAPTNPEVAAALVDQHLWITMDDGVTWRVVAELFRRVPSEPVEESFEFDESDSEDDFTVASDDEEEEAPFVHTEQPPNLPAFDSSIAVGDNGQFAFTQRDRIVIGTGESSLRNTINLADGRKVVFDSHGNLWAITQNELLHFEDPVHRTRPSKTWRLGNACDIIHGAVAGELYAFDQRGIVRIATDKMESGPLDRIGVAGVEAIASTRGGAGPVLYFVAHGELRRRRGDGDTETVGKAPADLTGLAVGESGEIRFNTEHLGWLEKRGVSFRPSQKTAVAVDAAGRFWFGDEDGPGAPRKEASVVESADVAIAFSAVGETVVRILAASPWGLPRPPRCRRYHMSPFPGVVLEMRYGTAKLIHRGIEVIDDRGQLKVGVFIGVKLGWKWGPVTPFSCFERVERYHRDVIAKGQRTASHVSALERAAAGKARTFGLSEIIAGRMNRERLLEMIRVTSGFSIKKENQ